MQNNLRFGRKVGQMPSEINHPRRYKNAQDCQALFAGVYSPVLWYARKRMAEHHPLDRDLEEVTDAKIHSE